MNDIFCFDSVSITVLPASWELHNTTYCVNERFLPPTADKEAVTKALNRSTSTLNIEILVKFQPSHRVPLRARTDRALVKSRVGQTSSNVAIKQILSFTLTEKGAFVREILLQEVAKGLDALGLATLDSLTSVAITSIPFVASSPSSSLTEEDIMNLRMLRRLMLLLSGLQKNGSSTVLPPELQQQLLLLPADLAGRLISRAAARTIRRMFL
ncbi:hypothetical protein GH714_024380 [Hevea brasiliensis]|uniref:Uncharacterized protein n=1 Tax=Hevea brasiliensis TaxID=3981 RepID=A0A6A6LBM9_HEVBR|nr:hypothetical protein GH714_024380 [Hevea brasiliensis]